MQISWDHWTFESGPLQMMLDPAERDLLKSRRPGTRRFTQEATTVALARSHHRDSQSRQTARSFSAGPVSYDSFCRLLESLSAYPVGPEWKWAYASAGNSYSVQTYTYIHESTERGVQGVPGGSYYYNPAEHKLYRIASDVGFSRASHAVLNRPVFEAASVSLFLVVELAAILPLYGGQGVRMACLEAGMMCQALDEAAVANDIGICHIGAVDESTCARAFGLGPTHLLVHSLMAGRRQHGEI